MEDTFKATTQLDKAVVCLPMRRHYKSWFPALNVRRLDDIVATDTFYASTPAHDGSTCAQLFVGKSSYFTQVFGMKSESQFPSRFIDFIMQFGEIKGLMSYNAKAENSKVVQDFLRQYMIMDANSKTK